MSHLEKGNEYQNDITMIRYAEKKHDENLRGMLDATKQFNLALNEANLSLRILDTCRTLVNSIRNIAFSNAHELKMWSEYSHRLLYYLQ